MTPAATVLGLTEESVYQGIRPFGENYDDQSFLTFSRGLNLTGIYYGDQADALRALVGGAGYQPWRLVVDAGADNKVHAGQCLVRDLRIEAPIPNAITASGTAPVSGRPWIGAGRYTDLAARTVDVVHDTIVVVLDGTGIPTVGQIGISAAAGVNTWVRTIATHGAGVYIITAPLLSGGVSRPTSGTWAVRMTRSGYATNPGHEWSPVQAEGPD